MGKGSGTLSVHASSAWNVIKFGRQYCGLQFNTLRFFGLFVAAGAASMDELCQNCYFCGKLLTTSNERKHRCRLDNDSLQNVLLRLKEIVLDEVDVNQLQ